MTSSFQVKFNEINEFKYALESSKEESSGDESHDESLQDFFDDRIKMIAKDLNSSSDLSDEEFIFLACKWSLLDLEVDSRKVRFVQKQNPSFTLLDLLIKYSEESENLSLDIQRHEIDLMKLGETDWLTSDHINAYMEILKIRYGDGFDFFVPESCRLEDNLEYRNLLEDRLEQSYSREINALKFNGEVIAFPVNIGGYHWTMAVADRRTNTLHYYDSLGSLQMRNNQHLRTRLSDILEVMKALPSDCDGEWRIENSTENSRIQRDSYNCGVYSIWAVEAKLRGKDPLRLNDIIKYRKKVMENIRKKFKQVGVGLGARLELR